MSWAEFHSASESIAARAEMAARSGDLEKAAELYRQAAEQEERALDALPVEKTRTVGITVVSAASLWLMARDLKKSEAVAYRWLQKSGLPQFAVTQLRDLLQTVWGEEMRANSPIKFLPGDVLVSVSGGDVLYGGAPMDLILQKVEEVKAVVIRTIEMKLQQPLRTARAASELIREHFQPWLIQQPAGSYQFAVRVRSPDQIEAFPGQMPAVETVTSTSLDILRAAVEDPEDELVRIVPDAGYRSTFLKLSRNLAPTGKSFGQLSLGSASGSAAPVVMLPTARTALNELLRRQAPKPSHEDLPGDVRVRGILRGLSLDRDWLEVLVTESGESKIEKIYDAGDTVDDVIGPMVNRPVIVDAYRKKGQERLHLRDIQPEE